MGESESVGERDSASAGRRRRLWTRRDRLASERATRHNIEGEGAAGA